MKYLLALIVVLISFPAFADHHRGHAVMQIDKSLRFLDAALVIAESTRDQSEGLAALNLNKYMIYAGKYRDTIAAARELLLTGGDLEDIRRLVSAPGMNGELESADYGIASTVSILAIAVRYGADDRRMSLILTRHSKADQFLGWAHWHVIDAIREEIYLDPEFQ